MKYIILVFGLLASHFFMGIVGYNAGKYPPNYPLPGIKGAPNYLLQEYQIRLELDSAYIYDGDRLVGSAPHGKDGIDSVILLDNL